jgi:diguanylate cyclase (GGDEF)-like protein
MESKSAAQREKRTILLLVLIAAAFIAVIVGAVINFRRRVQSHVESQVLDELGACADEMARSAAKEGQNPDILARELAGQIAYGDAFVFTLNAQGSLDAQSEGADFDALAPAVQQAIEDAGGQPVSLKLEAGGATYYAACAAMSGAGGYAVAGTTEEGIQAITAPFYDDAAALTAWMIGAAAVLGIIGVVLVRRQLEREKVHTQRLKLDELSYYQVLDTTDFMYFDWDVPTGRIHASSQWETILGCSLTAEMIGDGLLVDESEELSFQGMLMLIEGGETFAEDEFRMRYTGGYRRWFRFRVTGIHDDDGALHRVVAMVNDIDDQKSRELVLMNDARMDSLTGLLNKKAAEGEIKTALMLSSYRSGSIHGFLIMDIDDFKGINDNYGHDVGDEVLVQIALKLNSIFRASDTIGRIGGDEFAVLMKELADPGDAARRAQTIVDTMGAIVLPGGGNPSVSVGVALYPAQGTGYEELYRNADKAMYQAKNWGKGCFACYGEEAEEAAEGQPSENKD